MAGTRYVCRFHAAVAYTVLFGLQQTREEWQMVFFLAAGIYALGGVIYIICARGELQPWAVDTSEINDVKSVEGQPLTDMSNGAKEPVPAPRAGTESYTKTSQA